MKILFSADWHLGYTLGGANPQPRLDDQIRNIELVARYCVEHDVDVLAIAGDVFEAQEKGLARTAVGRMMAALAEPLSRGMRIVAVAGNHDRDYFMETANVWLGAEASAGEERVILRTKPELLTLRAGGEAVNFALLPFPTAARYDMRRDDATGAAQRNEQTARVFGETMEELRKQGEAQHLPTVLITHVTVQGSTVHAHRISARDDVVIPRGSFPEFELTVVGHIHKAEQIGGGQFYYVGALDRMDVGEKAYEPRVLLADIGPQGLREISSLPLDPTPFEAIRAGSEDDLHAAAARIERPADTLVKLTLTVPFGAYVAPLIDLARQLFPRLYGNVELDVIDAPKVEARVSGLNPADIEGNIDRYIDEAEIPADEKPPLKELARELRAQQKASAAE